MITLVAAISKNLCIGKDNDLPWDIPEDMEHMRAVTLGKVLIMGRKTWESIPENRRPLPKRTNVVITRNKNYELPKGVERYDSIEEAVEAHKNEEIIGFGGQRIFEEMIKIADELDLTLVNQEIEECHAFFPAIDPKVWEEAERDDRDGFSFVKYTHK
ncbi:dihydrofolate reductase [Patescibacteria group bacterium]|nr:dihydrofolate reductase [Patescibacteria group bacterium]